MTKMDLDKSIVKHTWILSVIEDVERYAKLNNLHEIGASLAELRIIAGSEIAAKGRVEANLYAALEAGNSNVVRLPQLDEDLAEALRQRSVVVTHII